MAQDTPAPQQQNPYAPDGVELLTFDTFLGIDTSAPRSGIANEAMAWCDGFMPVARNNARTLPGVGTKLYHGPSSGSVVFYDFANIGGSSFCIVFLADGSIIAVNVLFLTVTRIAPAGTVLNPAIGQMGISQWGSQFILIVANQPNGYFIWDGTTLYTAGTLGPLVTVINSGLNYTSPPTVTASGGSGSGATFNATINGGSVDQIFVNNPGSGYLPGDLVVLTISGGGSDAQARATATIGATGSIQSVSVTDNGGGYTSLAYVQATGGGGTGSQLGIQAAAGSIDGVTVLNGGIGYTSVPTIAIFDPGGATGVGFAATAYLGYGAISAVSIASGGSGYVTVPSVVVTGDGSGAVLQAKISGGAVTGVDVINGGIGYTKVSIQFIGGNNAAEATIDIMPSGVQGTAIETYQSAAWIVKGSLLQFSAPESVMDFSTSSGGGALRSTDSFLRLSYIRPMQTNGFLYLVADSSINYISGVQTSGTPPTTTFTNQNADPEIGTPWPAAINVFSRNIVMANSFGVHVSYGGAVSKASTALDGVYFSVPNLAFGGFQPSCAKAVIFGQKVWMILLPVVDPITKLQVNKLFMWNGKYWWSSQQDITLTFVSSLEINSVLIAFGTDGQDIYPLFINPSTKFTKTIQSKLWDGPGGYEFLKSTSRFWCLAEYHNVGAPDLTVSIDNENGSAVYTVKGPSLVGNFVSPPLAVGQSGTLAGVTVSTNAADMSLVAVKIADEIQGYRG